MTAMKARQSTPLDSCSSALQKRISISISSLIFSIFPSQRAVDKIYLDRADVSQSKRFVLIRLKARVESL
jgi:hypothetical protein